MKNNYLKTSMICQVLGVSLLFGCASWSNTGTGTAIGGGTGAAVGAVIGNRTGQAGKGAAIGAVVGGAAGAAIGIYMDNQASKMEEIKDAEIERVDEAIKVTFDSGILFGFDSYALTPQAQENIMKFSEILNEYPDTDITIVGHTDNVGSEEYNKNLSQQRAQAVLSYLKMQNVDADRLTAMGESYTNPVASNETEEGKAENRRVELLITANEDLVEKAEKGEIK